MKKHDDEQTPAAIDERQAQEGKINDDAESAFFNLAAVLKYLQDQGWKITKPSLYRHHKEGKILPDTDGSFKRSAVIKYAKAFLKLTATGKRQQETTDHLQREKLQEELKNLRLKNERDKFNFEKDQGRYVLKDQLEIELATRAGILIAGLKHWIASNAAAWIDTTGGNTKKTGELINLMNDELDEHINRYAAGNIEYEVIIDADENEHVPTDETRMV